MISEVFRICFKKVYGPTLLSLIVDIGENTEDASRHMRIRALLLACLANASQHLGTNADVLVYIFIDHISADSLFTIICLTRPGGNRMFSPISNWISFSFNFLYLNSAKRCQASKIIDQKSWNTYFFHFV